MQKILDVRNRLGFLDARASIDAITYCCYYLHDVVLIVSGELLECVASYVPRLLQRISKVCDLFFDIVQKRGNASNYASQSRIVFMRMRNRDRICNRIRRNIIYVLSQFLSCLYMTLVVGYIIKYRSMISVIEWNLRIVRRKMNGVLLG